MRRWRIGVAANLDADNVRSVHRRAFERALAMATDAWPAAAGIDIRLDNDRASAEGAAAVAQRFVDAHVDVVVGHFASAAAAAAAPVYAAARIPLLLPAATSPPLTRHATTFRLCGHDDAMAQQVARGMRHQLPRGRVCLQSDGTPHADALCARVALGLPPSLQRIDAVEQADLWFFGGRFHSALQALQGLGAQLPQHIWLSDDSVHPDLCTRLPAGIDALRLQGLWVPGYLDDPQRPQAMQLAQRHQARYGEPPGVYFLEMVAGLQIALQLRAFAGEALAPVLAQRSWDTALGPVAFAQRELLQPRFAVWEARRDGLRIVAVQG